MNLPNVPEKNWENKILLKRFSSQYEMNQIQQRLFSGSAERREPPKNICENFRVFRGSSKNSFLSVNLNGNGF